MRNWLKTDLQNAKKYMCFITKYVNKLFKNVIFLKKYVKENIYHRAFRLYFDFFPIVKIKFYIVYTYEYWI